MNHDMSQEDAHPMIDEKSGLLISQLFDGELDETARDAALELVQKNEAAREFLRSLESDRADFSSLRDEATGPESDDTLAALREIRESIAAEKRLMPISQLADGECDMKDIEAIQTLANEDHEAGQLLTFIHSQREQFAAMASPDVPAIDDALAGIHAAIENDPTLLEQASLLVDDELDPPTASSVRLAVEADSEASDFVDFVERSRDDIRRQAEPDPTAPVEPALRDIQAAIEADRKPGGLLRFPALWGIAAAAALFIGFGLSSYLRDNPAPAPTEIFTAMAVEEVETEIPNAFISVYNAPESDTTVIWIDEMPELEPEA